MAAFPNNKRWLGAIILASACIVATLLVTETPTGGLSYEGYDSADESTLLSSALQNTGGHIHSVLPAAGPFRGGNTVTITGVNLITSKPGDLISVKIKGRRVARVISQAPNKIVVKAGHLHTASHEPGSGDVVVESRLLGRTHLVGAYQYHSPPRITKVTPSSGPHSGGNHVMLRGRGLCSVRHVSGKKDLIDAVVTVAGARATATRCTRHALYVMLEGLPASPTRGRTGDIQVRSAAYGTTRMPAAYTYLSAPEITNVTPRSGPAHGGNRVRIEGSGLNAGSGSRREAVSVRFGHVVARVLRYSPTMVEVVVPRAVNAARCVPLHVTSKIWGAGHSMERRYCYHSTPKVIRLEPPSGRADGGTLLRIVGKHLHHGDVKGVTIGTHHAEVLEAPVHGRHVVVRTPHFRHSEEAMQLPVTVHSTTRGRSTFGGEASGFMVVGRGSISRVSPNHGPMTGGTKVTVEGKDLTTGEPADLLGASVQGVPAKVLFASPTKVVLLTGTAHAASPALSPVRISSLLHGDSTSPRFEATQFAYLEMPHITTVHPTSGAFEGAHRITINGEHLCRGACEDLKMVTVGSATIKRFAVRSPSRIVFDVPHADVVGGDGHHTITTVSSHHGAAELPGAYVVRPQGALASVEPSDAPMKGGMVVTVFTNTDTTAAAGFKAWLAGVPARIQSVEHDRVTLLAGDGSSEATARATARGDGDRMLGFEGPVVLEMTLKEEGGTMSIHRDLGVRFRYNPPCSIEQAFVVGDRANEGENTVVVRGHNLGFGDEKVLLDNGAAHTRVRTRRGASIVELQVHALAPIHGVPSVKLTSARAGACTWSPPMSKPLRRPANVEGQAAAWNKPSANAKVGKYLAPAEELTAAPVVFSPPPPPPPHARKKGGAVVLPGATWGQKKGPAHFVPGHVPRPTVTEAGLVLMQDPAQQRPPAAVKAVGMSKVSSLPQGYHLDAVSEGALMMADRQCYRITKVPERFSGMVHLRGPNFSKPTAVSFVVASSSTVYVAVDSRHASPILSKGFHRTGSAVTLGGCHRPTKMPVYASRTEAGLVEVQLKPGYMTTMWVDPQGV